MKTKINCLCCVLIVLQVMVSLTSGREGQRRRKQSRSARFQHQRRRMKPRAAVTMARWNTHRQRSCTPFWLAEGSFAVPGVLRIVL
ncbi:hypothetical protein BDE02_15G032000 [Populus trichocarpa]|nr:hypothetical protein BDE02_15G032000 [Populus trichocarpa]